MITTRLTVGTLALLAGLAGSLTAAESERRPFQPADVHRLKTVGSPAISPEGDRVAYTVRTHDVEEDRRNTDLYMVSWEGTRRVQLTHTEKGSEGSPSFSPGGRYLGFITARGGGDGDKKGPKHKAQVWLLDRAGGEAFRLTELPGGVSAFRWAPDGKRLVVVSQDPDPDEVEEEEAEENDTANAGPEGEEPEAKKDTKKKSKMPKPIIVDRYRFKQDRQGYLVRRYDRLHLFDLESKESVPLTPGEFDSTQPDWSPDGKWIVFTSKRPGPGQPDPDRNRNSDLFLVEAKEGAEPRRLTSWGGADSQPRFSPDGTRIAYVRGPEEKYDFYDPTELGVVGVDGGEPVLATRELDRSVGNVRWSRDGSSVYFVFDDDRDRILARVPAAGGEIERLSLEAFGFSRGVVRGFEIGKRGFAVLATSPHWPEEIYRLEDGRALTDYNRELREQIRWGRVRGIDATGKDGVRVGSILVEPPDYIPGKPYPTIAYIHGGPVAQDGYEFDWMAQAFAARGYLVVQPNYRGSSGRGTEFSRAIYGAWGTLEITDIHTVIDHLVTTGLSDPDRLGIGGWSYGGITTNYAIASDTRFSAAVSGSGIANMLTGYGTDQYIWLYEGEIGKPWDHEALQRYLKLSYPFLHADRIKTPTLFMCGEKDFNVPLINSEQMYQALRSLNVPTELVIYPGQYHGLSVPSYLQDRAERMLAWFDEHQARP